MKKSSVMLLMLGLLATGGVIAAEPAPNEELEAKLEAARARLEEAAREVAQLSAELGGPIVDRFISLQEGGRRRAIIGVQLDPESGSEGARVAEVSPGGPAAEAGLRVGDVIVNVNGEDVRGEGAARKVMRAMRDIEPESKVKVQVLRNGKPLDFDIATRSAIRPPFVAARGVPVAPLPPGAPAAPLAFGAHRPYHELADMELATLSPELGKYFGTDKGVLIVRAPRSDALQLKDGDVILSIDGREPTSSSHATRILRSYQAGEKINLRIMRERKPMNLELNLPERGPVERRVRRAQDAERSGARDERNPTR